MLNMDLAPSKIDIGRLPEYIESGATNANDFYLKT